MRKKKNSTEPVIEENVPVESVDHGAPTQEEVEVHEEVSEEYDRANTMRRLNDAVSFVLKQFNLEGKGYAVTSFSDKGSKLALTMANESFQVAITINSPEEWGIRDQYAEGNVW